MQRLSVVTLQNIVQKLWAQTAVKKYKFVRVVLRQCGWKLILLFDQLADYGCVQNYAGASDQRDNKLQNNGHLSEQILQDRRDKCTVRKYVIISGQLLQAWGC